MPIYQTRKEGHGSLSFFLLYLYLSQKKVSSPANALSCAILAMVAHQASELEAKRASDMPMWRLVLHLAKSVRIIMYSVLIFLP